MAAERTLKSLSDKLLELDANIRERNQQMDTYSFVESMKNSNTKKKTKYDISRLQTWFQSVGENREVLDIPANTKCYLLNI